MIKQVIILRKDLNMRKGKMVAQGSHASLMSYLQANERIRSEWLGSGQTKICVGVDSELELISMHERAQEMGLVSSLILDSGKTEFDEPTWTAVGIGPNSAEEIDKITGKLKLL